MKKFNFFVLIVGLLFFMVGCSDNKDYLKDISFKELTNKIEAKEEFFFVATQDGCAHCEKYIPTLKNVLNNHKVVGYNLNLSTLSSEENKKFDELFKITGTPTTVFIKDGTEVSLLQRITGNASEDQIVAKLKNNNYIK